MTVNDGDFSSWRPRTRKWVDPAKEALQIRLQLEKGLISRTAASRDLGRDFRETVNEIAAENEYAESQGVDLNATDLNEVAVSDDEINKLIKQDDDEEKK